MKMDFDTYQAQALVSKREDHFTVADRLNSKRSIDLLHGAMVASKESGELLAAVYDHVYYGKPLNVKNIIEEVGDVLWGLAILLKAIGVTFASAAWANVTKLRGRYPEGKFTERHARERRDKI